MDIDPEEEQSLLQMPEYRLCVNPGVKTTRTITFLLPPVGVVNSLRSRTHEQSSRWRHRPSHPSYPLPWALGERRGAGSSKEGSCSYGNKTAGCFEYLDRCNVGS